MSIVLTSKKTAYTTQTCRNGIERFDKKVETKERLVLGVKRIVIIGYEVGVEESKPGWRRYWVEVYQIYCCGCTKGED